MSIREWFRKASYLFRRDRFAAELDEEMQLHLDMRARKLQSQGVAAGDAPYEARRQFGNRGVMQDLSTELWGWTAWERLLQDIRLGFRALRKTPGFTAVSVLTLALGLGINTAVFSVVNAIMLRALPYPDSERLISLWEDISRNPSGRNRSSVSPANLVDYRAHTPAFESLAGYSTTPKNLTGIGSPERLQGESVTAEFFPTLGVKPALGRNFLPEEDREGGERVVIVSYDFWQRRLGGDPGVLRQSVQLDGRSHRIVGVLPQRFRSPSQLTMADPVEFYVPAAYPAELLASHCDHEINVVGRLKSDAGIEIARGQLAALRNTLAKQYPPCYQNIRAGIAPLRDDLVRNVKDSMFALLGASGLIVLITCVNVANLLLVRALGRRHETSVRFALGASRFRIVRQFAAESALVAAGGLVAGVLLGNILLRAVLALAPPNIPRIADVTMDWKVFGLATAIATLIGILFGIAPAWQASQAKAVDSLKAAARTIGGKSQIRWRSALTIAEVALSVVLLIGSGLLLKSFVAYMGVDLGFHPDRVVTMTIGLPGTRYPTADQRYQFYEQLESGVRGLPGVRSVAFANNLPMRGGWGSGINIDGIPGQTFSPGFQAVNPGYFETLGIALLRGRLMGVQDYSGTAPVAVVNQAFARKLLNGSEAIGRRIRRGEKAPWIEIVGVVNDIRREGKAAEIVPQVYLSAAQTNVYPVPLRDFAVRSSQDPRSLVNAIQSEVWRIDKDQPIVGVYTYEEIVDRLVAQRRFQTLLLMIFAAVAACLSVIGIYSVLSHSVSQRTSEIGIRIALGAKPAAILGLVMKQAGGLIAAGIAIGLWGAYSLAKYLETLLFQVPKHDWRTYVAAVAVLAGVALAASLIPARRGAKVNPIEALRCE